MERGTFLKFIQEKNDNCDPRKLSFQSLSSGKNQSKQKAIFNCDLSPLQSQLPAFINRKVKNLKPYTNHFKRFNIQTTKISKQPHKSNNFNKNCISNQSEKIKIAKSNLLKQLGIGREIKPSQNPVKMPQISAYQQFLQKTSSMFTTSNALQIMYQSCVKKNSKIHQETYQSSQSSQRQHHPDNDAKLLITKQQRRSIATNSSQQIDPQFAQKGSKKSIKSMNQFPKNQQGLLKSDKVGVVPNSINLKHEDIFCMSHKKTFASIKKKYSVPFNEAQKKQFTTFTQSQRKKSENIVYKDQQSDEPSDQVIVSVPRNFQTLRQSQKSERQIVIIQNKNIESIRYKQSPKKQQISKNSFNFNLGLNSNCKKQPPKILLTKNNTDATINVDKQKSKPNNQMAPPSNVTAFSYIVYEPLFSQNNAFKFTEDNLKSNTKVFGNNRVLAALNCKSVVQIASLTKIMTFILTLQVCERLKIDSACEKVRIGKFQEGINGTSAQIKEGEIYTVQQLYYGLMLPSGNDASLALAIWGGKKLLIHELKQKEKLKKKTFSEGFTIKMPPQNQNSEGILKLDQKKIVLKKKKCYQRFILEMNKKARWLGMTKTTYANSHGLSNNLNKSCAFDLCILCQHAMTNEKFKKVVSTIDYRCKIQYEITQGLRQESEYHKKVNQCQNENQQKPVDDVEHENQHCDEQSTESLEQKEIYCSSPCLPSQRQKYFSLFQTNTSSTKSSQTSKPPVIYGQREVFWLNTHKLLSKQEYIGIKTGITNTAGPCLASCLKTKQNRCFIIIVLNSKKLSYRFKDTEVLKKWIYKKQSLITQLTSPKPDQQQYQNNQIQSNQNSPGRGDYQGAQQQEPDQADES